MKFMKILFVATTGLFFWNIEGALSLPQTQFDLPNTEIYGLGEQVKINDRLKCYLKHNHVIEFPLNGRQPTTKDTIKWSCANVDDDVITEWYMQLFGVNPLFDGTYVKAGYTLENTPGRIIDFVYCSVQSEGGGIQTAMDVDEFFLQSNSRSLEKKEVLLRKDKFKAIFRQIAAHPVGRIFLYRLLIEIRRKSLDNGNGGITENPSQMPSDEALRNNARSIEIMHGFWQTASRSLEKKWRYFPAGPDERPKIAITFDSTPIFIVNGKRMIFHVSTERELAALMFHKMLHWYYELRAYERTKKERVYLVNKELPIFKFFPGVAQQWYETIPFWTEGCCFVGNELRVICGRLNESDSDTLLGDDLSENAFRYFSNLPLRFGYFERCKEYPLCRDICFSILYAATDIFE